MDIPVALLTVDPGLAALLTGAGGIGGLLGVFIKGRMDRDIAAQARSDERSAAAQARLEERRAADERQNEAVAAAVASARLDKRWTTAYTAAKWAITQDPTTQRLGRDHLMDLQAICEREQLVGNVGAVDLLGFVRTTLNSALGPKLEELKEREYDGDDLNIVQLPGTPQPKLPPPADSADEGDPEGTDEEAG